MDTALFVAAQSGHWRHWPRSGRYRIASVWYAAIPFFTATLGYVPGWAGLGNDLPAGVGREWARWGRNPESVFRTDRDKYARFAVPVTSYSIEDDTYVPVAPWRPSSTN